MPSPAITIDELVVRYGTRTAVDGLSLTAGVGRITALLGPNGAGKTSTVEAICGIRHIAAGSIEILGRSADDPRTRVELGVMLQNGGFYATAKPAEWLRYLARLYPLPRPVEEVLDLVGIDPAARTTMRRMSGGEQQRVKLAAALLPNPKALILDEPTAGLDPLGRRNLLNALGRLRDEGVGILLTTHVLPDVEELADHVVVLSNGRLLAQGSVAELTGSTSALTFRGPVGLDTRSLVAALPSGYRAEEQRSGRYIVFGEPTPHVMASVTAWCAQHGVLATELTIGDRTLEQILIDAAEDRS